MRVGDLVELIEEIYTPNNGKRGRIVGVVYPPFYSQAHYNIQMLTPVDNTDGQLSHLTISRSAENLRVISPLQQLAEAADDSRGRHAAS